jgi:DNA repair exonuclease SbcCD ATPase subunit
LARYKEHEDFVKGLLRRKKRVREEIDNLKRNLDHVRYEKVFFNYCLTVFSRNGLPAFLNSYLCPQLNAAAEHHSELWSEGHIKVRFDVEEGVFVPRIINPSGGENIGDQSGGEDKIASIITIFAARDVLTPCNLAILDEPGDGLDATNASWFARKLREVAPKVGSVFVTTHNPNIISELEGCRRIHVVKKNGVSYIHG